MARRSRAVHLMLALARVLALVCEQAGLGASDAVAAPTAVKRCQRASRRPTPAASSSSERCTSPMLAWLTVDIRC